MMAVVAHPRYVSRTLLIAMALLLCSVQAIATPPRDIYRQAVQLATQGRDGEAVAMLAGAANILHGQNIWRERMLAAEAMLAMRKKQTTSPLPASNSAYTELADQYLRAHPAPEKVAAWIPGLLAALFPGSGHAWLGRWHDAAVAAMLVWPMLLLTFWAWKRRMGPVTVFFGLLTLWLWSGTVFSAISLAERGSMETYMAWWQGLWQFSGLPGRPW